MIQQFYVRFKLTLRNYEKKCKTQRIMRISFALCSLIRNFSLCEKLLTIERTKKNKFSFGSLLTYS